VPRLWSKKEGLITSEQLPEESMASGMFWRKGEKYAQKEGCYADKTENIYPTKLAHEPLQILQISKLKS
jgi:hypothetical protein